MTLFGLENQGGFQSRTFSKVHLKDDSETHSKSHSETHSVNFETPYCMVSMHHVGGVIRGLALAAATDYCYCTKVKAFEFRVLPRIFANTSKISTSLCNSAFKLYL